MDQLFSCVLMAMYAGLILAAAGAAPVAGAEKKENVVGTGFTYGDGRYHLFYDDTSTGDYQVAYAYSEDGLHWVKPELDNVNIRGRKSNLLGFARGPKGSWNSNRMCSSGALYQPDKWRIFVPGYYTDADGKLHSQLGYGESDDLINWKLVGEQPIIPNGAKNTFDWALRACRAL